MKQYAVKAVRSGGWWSLLVPDLPGVHSQARTLKEAPAAAREAIAVMLDVDSVEVRVDVQPDE